MARTRWRISRRRVGPTSRWAKTSIWRSWCARSPTRITRCVGDSASVAWSGSSERDIGLFARQHRLSRRDSIQEHQLRRWAGIHPESLPFLRKVRETGRTPSLRFARIWIHRNRAGSRELSDAKPFPLQLPEGIAIYPSDGSNYPRLPLLGLRAIIKN